MPRSWSCSDSPSSPSSAARRCAAAPSPCGERPMADIAGASAAASGIGWWGVPLAIAGGAIRGGTTLLGGSLGETVTEKAGRINLGLEGTLLMGAMTAFAVSLATGNPWLGVVGAAAVGIALGALHGGLCSQARVNDPAMGIALMLAGSGLAFWLGKPLIQPTAPGLPSIVLGGWTSQPALKAALSINPLFVIGVLAAFAVHR